VKRRGYANTCVHGLTTHLSRPAHSDLDWYYPVNIGNTPESHVEPEVLFDPDKEPAETESSRILVLRCSWRTPDRATQFLVGRQSLIRVHNANGHRLALSRKEIW
jgi:hypothetical protein